jgi:hypothetical protein
MVGNALKIVNFLSSTKEEKNHLLKPKHHQNDHYLTKLSMVPCYAKKKKKKAVALLSTKHTHTKKARML